MKPFSFRSDLDYLLRGHPADLVDLIMFFSACPDDFYTAEDIRGIIRLFKKYSFNKIDRLYRQVIRFPNTPLDTHIRIYEYLKSKLWLQEDEVDAYERTLNTLYEIKTFVHWRADTEGLGKEFHALPSELLVEILKEALPSEGKRIDA